MVHDPSATHCPICGRKLHKGRGCDEAILRAIDAANTRAGDAEISSDFDTFENFRRTESDRLREGFKMLRLSDDDPKSMRH